MRIKKIFSCLWQCYKRGGRRGVVNLFHNYFTIKLEPVVVKSRPVQLIIEPTTNCNLNCVMCDTKLRSRTNKDMTFEQFVEIIGQFPYVQRLAIQGVGEPTLNKDFYKMIRYAHDQGIWTFFNTNCTTLTESNIKKIVNSLPSEIRMSLDSLTRELYEKIRRGSNFDRVLSNIKNMSVACRNTPIKLSLWVVLMKQNVYELPKFVEFCKDYSIKRLVISSLQNWGNEEFGNVINDIKVKDVDISILQSIEKKVENTALGRMNHIDL